MTAPIDLSLFIGPQRTPEEQERDNAEAVRWESKLRDHCPVCGRFAKPGRPPEMDMNGEYPYTVRCKTHGEQWIV